MKALFSIALALLPLITAAGQVHQEDTYDAITKDTDSYFYNKAIDRSTYDIRNPHFYEFGYSRVTTPKDKFVCNTRIYVSQFMGKGYGKIYFDVEDFQKIETTTGMMRGVSDCQKRINLHGKRIHCKAKAYSVYKRPDTKKPYVKCYVADINFFPNDEAKSTVKYSIKYKKYRPIEKYHVIPLDSASTAKRNKKIAEKKEKERIEDMKYEKWHDKQIQKIREKKIKQRQKRTSAN